MGEDELHLSNVQLNAGGWQLVADLEMVTDLVLPVGLRCLQEGG